MANMLDEMTGPVMEEGKDVNVIAKQIPVTIGSEGMLVQLGIIAIGIIPLIIGLLSLKSSPIVGVILILLAFLPAGILFFKKKQVVSYFDALQQQIQSSASTIDNYLEQRVQVLKNCAKLVDKELNHEKETFTGIAALRAGAKGDAGRNEYAENIDNAAMQINAVMENYPQLNSVAVIADAMQKNDLLQREITAAREQYNDKVMKWNTEIFRFPLKKIVAAKEGYTTRIPFAASRETKEAARSEFF